MSVKLHTVLAYRFRNICSYRYRCAATKTVPVGELDRAAVVGQQIEVRDTCTPVNVVNDRVNISTAERASVQHTESITEIGSFQEETNIRNEWILAVRSGHLASVKEHAESNSISVNCRDVNGNTPLYLACLCQHVHVVRYLLRQGAYYNRSTLDGSRIYMSTNDTIRNVLTEYHTSQQRYTDRVRDHAGYVRMLNNVMKYGIMADTWLVVDQCEMPVHRCILAARAPQLAQTLSELWMTIDTLSMDQLISNRESLIYILQYLYCCKCGPVQSSNVMLINKDCTEYGLTNIKINLSKLSAKKLRRKISSMSLDKNCENNTEQANKEFLSDLKITVKIPNMLKDAQDDFSHLALHGIPEQFHRLILDNLDKGNVCRPGEELKFPPGSAYHDVIFIVDGLRFQAHKVFMVSRSDYFQRLLANFEGRTTRYPPGLEISHVTAEVFAVIMFYLYTDICPSSPSLVCEIVNASEIFQINTLKPICETILMEHIVHENVFDTFQTAEQQDWRNLRMKCIEHIGINIKHLINDAAFVDFMQKEGSQKSLESFTLLDDICYFIYDSDNKDSKASKDTLLAKLNNVLESLQLQKFKLILI